MPKCSFGCGQKAIKEFKNGNLCCSNSSSSCPAQKAKNSSAKKSINPWEGREHPRGMAGKPAWNAGKTKHNSSTVRSAGKKIKAFRKANPTVGWTKHNKHTDETRAIIREKSANNGGYREGSGRGNKGRYKGIHCDSSWELAFVLWCEIKGREVKRARKRLSTSLKVRRELIYLIFAIKHRKVFGSILRLKDLRLSSGQRRKQLFPMSCCSLVSASSLNKSFLWLLKCTVKISFACMSESRRCKPSWPSGSGLENRWPAKAGV